VNIPAVVNNAILDVNEKALYGNPLGEEGPIHNVYAAAGGRVLRTGIREGIGLYVMIEHPDRSGKISTYGHLSSIRVVSAERVTKGTIIGNYDADSKSEFYYTLEDMSGNLS
jgi:septal ring factor EnvC (AmiA/AmiB activator)